MVVQAADPGTELLLLRAKAGLPALIDEDDLSGPFYDVQVLSEEEQKDLRRRESPCLLPNRGWANNAQNKVFAESRAAPGRRSWNRVHKIHFCHLVHR